MFSSLLVSGCRWKRETPKDKAWDRCGDLSFSGGSKQLGQRLQVKAGGQGRARGEAGPREEGQDTVETRVPEHDGPKPESQLCPSVALDNGRMPLSLHFNICEMGLSQTGWQESKMASKVPAS